jgi:hypothetical protein
MIKVSIGSKEIKIDRRQIPKILLKTSKSQWLIRYGG